MNTEDYALSDTDIRVLVPEVNFWTYPQVSRMSHLYDLFQNGNEMAVILYLTKEHFGHYCCIFLRTDKNGNKIVSWFDPYGQEADDALMGHIDPDVRERLDEVNPHLFQLICESGLPAEYNNYRLEGALAKTC